MKKKGKESVYNAEIWVKSAFAKSVITYQNERYKSTSDKTIIRYTRDIAEGEQINDPMRIAARCEG
jgi:hypothetical protein